MPAASTRRRLSSSAHSAAGMSSMDFLNQHRAVDMHAPNKQQQDAPDTSWDTLLSAPPPRGIFAHAQSSTELREADAGLYYPLQEAAIPEAFEPWYTNREQHSGKTQSIDGGGAIRPLPKFVSGCAGLQYELAQSKHPYIMHRDVHQQLWERLRAAQQQDPQRVLVRGAAGCGKSVALAAAVERMRGEGWIVMYVPDCADITRRNAFFSKNPDTGMFDTRDAAQNILVATAEAHQDKLAQLPQQLEGGAGALLDLCRLPDTASDASLANAVVRLKLELYRLPQSQPAAIVLDGYNALFHSTAFTDAETPRRGSLEGQMRRVDAQELTLGANLRVLTDEDVGSAVVIAATSTSGSVPDVPLQLDAEAAPYVKVAVPLLSETELGRMLLYYRHVRALPESQAVTKSGVAAAHQLTQGDGKAVRAQLHFLLPYDPALDDMDTIGETYSNVNLQSLQKGS